MNIVGRDIQLFTFDGELVARVQILPFIRPAELVVFGQRFFIRRADGRYFEADGVTAGLAETTNALDELASLDREPSP